MNRSKQARTVVLKSASVVAVVFGLLSIMSGGNVLFGDDAARRAAGAYIGFVVWFNFLGGFGYAATGAGLWMRQRWAALMAFLIAGTTLLVFLAFGLQVAGGAAYELRTVAAMSFRLMVWLIIAWIAYRRIWRSS